MAKKALIEVAHQANAQSAMKGASVMHSSNMARALFGLRYLIRVCAQSRVDFSVVAKAFARGVVAIE